MQQDNKVDFFSQHPPLPSPLPTLSVPSHCQLFPRVVSTSFFILRSAPHRPANPREIESTNRPDFLLHWSQPFTNIFLPCPTKIEKNDPILKGTMEKKYCTHLKTCVCVGGMGGGSCVRAQSSENAESPAKSCCPQRVNPGQVTRLSPFT